MPIRQLSRSVVRFVFGGPILALTRKGWRDWRDVMKHFGVLVATVAIGLVVLVAATPQSEAHAGQPVSAPVRATPTPMPSTICFECPPPCSPRPPLRIQTSRMEPGRLRVTAQATNTGAYFVFLYIDRTDNAAVQIGDLGPIANPFFIRIGGYTHMDFFVHRVTPGKATTVQFTITDICGDWHSFAGGGPNAF